VLGPLDHVKHSDICIRPDWSWNTAWTYIRPTQPSLFYEDYPRPAAALTEAAALEQGVLAMNAAYIVLAALPYVDDATFCCASESGFEFVELPFEAFHCCHPGGVLCGICGIW